MLINYKLYTLFLCCLSEDLIKYYPPNTYFGVLFKDVKSKFIQHNNKMFIESPQKYREEIIGLLETESNDEIKEVMLLLDNVVYSYANQMEHPGLKNHVIFWYKKLFEKYF
jgi:hypothetical protein